MFSLSIIYSARKSPNHKLFKNYKYTNIEHKIFEELVPSVSPLLKKRIRLGGHTDIVDHSTDLSIPEF